MERLWISADKRKDRQSSTSWSQQTRRNRATLWIYQLVYDARGQQRLHLHWWMWLQYIDSQKLWKSESWGTRVSSSVRSTWQKCDNLFGCFADKWPCLPHSSHWRGEQATFQWFSRRSRKTSQSRPANLLGVWQRPCASNRRLSQRKNRSKDGALLFAVPKYCRASHKRFKGCNKSRQFTPWNSTKNRWPRRSSTTRHPTWRVSTENSFRSLSKEYEYHYGCKVRRYRVVLTANTLKVKNNVCSCQ